MTTREQERLAALHEYRLLDAPADQHNPWVTGALAKVRRYAFTLPGA